MITREGPHDHKREGHMITREGSHDHKGDHMIIWSLFHMHGYTILARQKSLLYSLCAARLSSNSSSDISRFTWRREESTQSCDKHAHNSQWEGIQQTVAHYPIHVHGVSWQPRPQATPRFYLTAAGSCPTLCKARCSLGTRLQNLMCRGMNTLQSHS